MKKIVFAIGTLVFAWMVASCFSTKGNSNASGGEVWGKDVPTRDISVDAFWMDEKEVTNSMYRQFVYWVRDSIIRERLADPAYGGDESYTIEEDKYGEPVTPHLNWNKALPRNPDEDQQRAMESVYITHPVTGEKMLDASQLNYRYEVFDYVMAAKRKYRLKNGGDRGFGASPLDERPQRRSDDFERYCIRR